MSIIRIASGPADVPGGGYVYSETNADTSRVEGSFRIAEQTGFTIIHPAAPGNTTWYHFMFARSAANFLDLDTNFLQLKDVSGDTLFTLDIDRTNIRGIAAADTTTTGSWHTTAKDTMYALDIKVEVGANLVVSYYLNSGLLETFTIPNSGSRTNPVAFECYMTATDGFLYFSEIIIADEDTRGMRLRELRPQSFGVFQEWDGTAAGIRDNDVATGVTTSTADARVSFGLSRIKFIQPGDIINRVVMQTYAQKGETGLPEFNHFFRFADTTVVDSATDIAVAETGEWYVEEFTTNPDTTVAWVPADFEGLQSGVRARA